MTGSRAQKNSRRAENHSVSAGSFHFEKAVLVEADQSRLLLLASFVFIIKLFILNGISGIKQGKMRIDSFSHSTVCTVVGTQCHVKVIKTRVIATFQNVIQLLARNELKCQYYSRLSLESHYRFPFAFEAPFPPFCKIC